METPSWLSKAHFPFSSRSIDVRGHNIHYIDEGEGPTLLLVHGNGSWSYGFRLTIPKLAPHYRVISLDLPGFGLTKARGNYSHLPEELSQDVEAFANALNLEDIHLYVEDWGGPIGLAFAGRRPELIRSLIISNTWAWPADESPALLRWSSFAGSSLGWFLITRVNFLARFAVPNVAILRTMDAKELQGYYMPYSTAESRLPQYILPREIRGSRSFLIAAERGLQKLSEKPVLLIWGEQDPGFGPAEKKKFAEHFPGLQTVLLPNAKHFVHVDQPNETAQAIIGVLTTKD